MKTNPSVSILIPTYRREHLLQEIMQSCVLAADKYAGEVEVLICNDDVDRDYICDNPLFRIINRKVRLSSVGYKRAYLWSQSRGDVVIYCDDDDVRSSNFISEMVGRMAWTDEGMGVFRTDRCICDTKEGEFRHASIDALWNYAISDSLMKFIGGVHIHNLALMRIKAWMDGWGIDFSHPERPNVIFRRNGIDTYHISSNENENNIHCVEANYSPGEYLLVPEWSRNWDFVFEHVDTSNVNSSSTYRKATQGRK